MRTHYRRRRRTGLLYLSLLLVLVFVLLALALRFGQGLRLFPSQPQASQFLFTDATHLEFLSWNGGSQLTGSLDEVVYLLPITVSSTPYRDHFSVTGEVAGQQIVLRLATQKASGTLETDALTLNVAGQQQRWYAAERQTYNELVNPFITSLTLRGALYVLTQDEQVIPVDSDPSPDVSAVAAAKQYVDRLTTQFTVVQQAAFPCRALQLFSQYYPASQSTFRLPFTATNASHSSLATHVADAQRIWKQVQRVSFPAVEGMPLAWVIPSSAVMAVLIPGQQEVKRINSFVRQQTDAMHAQRERYQQISVQVQTLQKACQ